MASRSMNYLRKHAKVILAIMGVVCMITFVVGPALLDMFSGAGSQGRGADPVVVTWSKGKVTENELARMRFEHGRAYGFLYGVLQECLQRGGAPVVGGRQLSAGQPIQFVGIPDDSSDEALIQTMLLAEEARQMGVAVDQAAVIAFLKQISGPELTEGDWHEIATNVIEDTNMTVGQLFDRLAVELRAQHVRVLAQAGLYSVPPGQVWEYFNRLNRRVTIEAFPVRAESFVSQVKDEPTEAELEKMFEEGRSRDPNPALAEPGFHQPHRVAFTYLKVDFKPFLEEAKKQITDAQIEEEYQKDIAQGKHKVLELPEEKPADPPAEDKPDEAQPTEVKPDDKPADAPPAEDAPPADVKPADESGKASDENPAEPSSGDCQETEQPKVEESDEPAAKKAEDPAPAEQPPADATDDKPEAAAPPADPAVAEATAETKEPTEPKFKPLSEVRDEIQTRLAQPIAQEARDNVVKEVMDAINDYGTRYRRWQSLKGSKIKTKATDPGQLNLQPLADKHGLEIEETPLVDRFQIAEHEIGQKVSTFDMEAARMGQFRMLRFADVAFNNDVPLFSAREIESSDPDAAYIYFRTAEEPAADLTFEEAKGKVAEAWKRQKAFELAMAEAQKSADQAKGKSLKDVADPMQVVTPPSFSWLTSGSLAFGFNEPELSPVPGIELPGREFMEGVFALKTGEVGVAPNQAHNTVYVVRVVSEEPSEEVLRERFLESGFSFEILSVAQRETMQVSLDWYRGIEEQYQVKWVRPPDTQPMEM